MWRCHGPCPDNSVALKISRHPSHTLPKMPGTAGLERRGEIASPYCLYYYDTGSCTLRDGSQYHELRWPKCLPSAVELVVFVLVVLRNTSFSALVANVLRARLRSLLAPATHSESENRRGRPMTGSGRGCSRCRCRKRGDRRIGGGRVMSGRGRGMRWDLAGRRQYGGVAQEG